ncbi:MAG: TRAP transporter large permease [Deltaproteobacteria bacterium]|nr:TRAP transporter large permease [Deltaproteobacteria bacterium]
MDALVYIVIGFSFLLLLTGMPLAIGFACTSLVVALTVMGLPLQSVAGFAFNSINSFPLLACPFFILAGNLLLVSGGATPVRDFLVAWFGHITGGLAVSGFVIGAFLGAVSGSSTACLAIMGAVLLPIMVSAGYDRPFSAAVCLTSAELGWLIPPSLGFILFGALTHIPIPDLFLGGLNAGFITTLFLGITAIVIARRRKYPLAPRATWKERGRTFVRAIPMLLMPVVILGGIYGGIFSPTESAAVACLYTLLLGVFFYRQTSWKQVWDALLATLKITTMIYFIIVGAELFSKMVTFVRLPQTLTEVILALELGPTAFLVVVSVFLLVVGFFFSSIAMIIVILPLFIPTVNMLEIDPVFYGVVAMMSTCIGEITPPMGPQLWFAEPICKVSMADMAKESWVFLAAMTVPIFIVIYIPDLVMFLVDWWR